MVKLFVRTQKPSFSKLGNDIVKGVNKIQTRILQLKIKITSCKHRYRWTIMDHKIFYRSETHL